MNSTVETAERIMRLKDDFKLKMHHFVDFQHFNQEEKQKHVCQTSYCIAGRLAAIDGYPDEYFGRPYAVTRYFDFLGYSADLVPEDTTWQFLFCEDWPNDLKIAKMRAAYVMLYGCAPEHFCAICESGNVSVHVESEEMWDEWYPQMKKYMADNPSEFE